MSLLKRKLVIKACRVWAKTDNRTFRLQMRPIAEMARGFVIVESINTLEFGIPGDELLREEIDNILKNNALDIRNGTLTIDIIKG